MADGLAVVEHHRVDRADRRGIRGQCVEVGQDALLDWMGDVDAPKTGAAGFGEEVTDVGGIDAPDVEVDQRVPVGQAQRARLALVQRGGERRADARTDQAHVHGVRGSDESHEVRVRTGWFISYWSGAIA